MNAKKIFVIFILASLSTRIGSFALTKDVSLAASSVGITPENLATAGFEPAEARLILNAILTEPDVLDHFVIVHSAGADRSDAIVQCRSRLEGAPEDDANRQVHALLLTEVVSLKEEIDTIEIQVGKLALADFGTDRIDRLYAIMANEAKGVDARFRVLDWRGGDWNRFRRAEAAERQAMRTGEELPEEERKILERYRLHPEVVQADARLARNLEAIRDVFDQFRE